MEESQKSEISPIAHLHSIDKQELHDTLNWWLWFNMMGTGAYDSVYQWGLFCYNYNRAIRKGWVTVDESEL